jgi:myo-inositol-1(or 4)-monophosphatase
MNQTSPTDLTDLTQLRAVAIQAAFQAGALLRQKWSQPLAVSHKGPRDLVTDADHASQALIVETIQTHFPDHGFIVEEKVASLPAAGPIIWIIDPVDGTTNYSRHQPNYCISIAAVKRPSPDQPNDPEVLVGVVYDPMQDELFEAALGQGAFLNETPIGVSATEDLNQSVIALDWSHEPSQRQQTISMLQQIIHEVQTARAIGSAALTLAWVAAGRLDAYFNLNLKPWDIAACKLLISEAGGQVVILDGRPWLISQQGCLATNGRLTPELIVKLTLDQ